MKICVVLMVGSSRQPGPESWFQQIKVFVYGRDVTYHVLTDTLALASECTLMYVLVCLSINYRT